MITIGTTEYGGTGNLNDPDHRKKVPGRVPKVLNEETDKQQALDRAARHDRRSTKIDILNDLEGALGKAGKSHLVKDGGLALQEWLDDPAVNHKFKDIGEVVQKLEAEGWLWAESGGGLGPKTIGARPAFTGDAAAMDAGKGNDRRHVISASTLGRAVENSSATQADVEDFLSRHGAAKTSFKTSNAAKAEAWRMLNSVHGNLWAGPSGDNRVAGFIRDPVHKAQIAIQAADATAPDFLKTVKAAVEAINKPVGPLRRADREQWKPMADVMVGVPDTLNPSAQGSLGLITARLQAAMEADVNGNIVPYKKEDIIKDLKDFEMNADLDLPSETMGKGYYEALSKIYVPLRDTADELATAQTPNLFAVGGPLDQYMALNCHKMEQSADVVNKMRTDFEKANAPKVPDVAPAPVSADPAQATAAPSGIANPVPDPNATSPAMAQDGTQVDPNLGTGPSAMDVDPPQPAVDNKAEPKPVLAQDGQPQTPAVSDAGIIPMQVDSAPQTDVKTDVKPLSTGDSFRRSSDSVSHGIKGGSTAATLSAEADEAKLSKKRAFFSKENHAESNKNRVTHDLRDSTPEVPKPGVTIGGKF